MQTHHLSIVDQVIRLSLIAALVYWSGMLILPLFSVLAWGFILAVALYPLYDQFQSRIGKHGAAVLVTMITLLVVVGSLTLMSNNMYDTVSQLTSTLDANQQMIPQPPETVKTWPVIGEQLYDLWANASDNMGSIINQYAKYLLDAGKFILGKTARISLDFLLFVIAVLFSGYLLSVSEGLIHSLNKLAERVAPERGRSIINIMNDTIKNVSRGVIGLSLFQAILFGIILLIAGMPAAGLLSFIALVMCIAQLGLLLLILPIIIWLFTTKTLLFASILSGFLVVIGLIDNFLKPYILARGLQTPMLVIFLGVIGGVLLHGVIGIFIGPVILAIFYDLANQWLADS